MPRPFAPPPPLSTVADLERRGEMWRSTWRLAQPCPDCGALAMLVVGPADAAVAQCVTCGAEHRATHVIDRWIAWAERQRAERAFYLGDGGRALAAVATRSAVAA